MTTDRFCRSAVVVVLTVLAMVLVIGDASVGYANAKGARAKSAVTSAAPRNAGTQLAAAQLGGVTAIAAGFGHSVALRSNSTVVAWGDNNQGQLGDGTTVSRQTPVRVCAVGQVAPCQQFLTGVIAIAAGDTHSLALLRDRTVVAWGGNNRGQLGDGTTTNRTIPVRVCAVGQVAPCSQFLGSVRALTAGAGGDFNLAQLMSNAAVAWGLNNFGQLGDGTTTNRTIPVRVCAVGQVAPCSQFLSGIRSVTTGTAHSLAVVGNAVVVAWGWNNRGQLGDGTTVTRTTPVRVCAVGQVAPCHQFLSAVNAIVAGDSHSMALRGDGGPVAWGWNNQGQLGDGTTVTRTTPVRVCAVGETAPCDRFLFGIRHVDSGELHSMAQLSSGGVLTWGFNGNGQLGDGTLTSRTTPDRVCAAGQAAPCTQHLLLIRAVAAGRRHGLVLQPNYTVAAWGLNGTGQLGDGTLTSRSTPVQVLAPQT